MKYFFFLLAFLNNGSPSQAQQNDLELSQFSIEALEQKIDSLDSIKKYSQAIQFAERALEMVKNNFGKQSIEYEEGLGKLGKLNGSLENFSKCFHYYNQALFLAEKNAGKYHPRYCHWQFELAKRYTQQDIHKHFHLMQDALDHTKSVVGENHILYATQLKLIGRQYKSRGQYDKALPIYLRVLEILEELEHNSDLEYSKQINNLALLYVAMGDNSRALPLLEEAIQILNRLNINNGKFYATLLTNLAKSYQNTGQYEKAETLYLKAIELDISKKTKLTYLAGLYREKGEFKKAYETLKPLINANPKYYGLRCIEMIKILFAIEKYQNALEYSFKALEGFKQNFGIYYPGYGRELLQTAKLLEISNRPEDLLLILDQLDVHTKGRVINQFPHFSEYEQQKLLASIHSFVNYIQSFGFRNPNNQLINEMCFDVQLLLKGMLLDNNIKLAKAFEGNSIDNNFKLVYEEWSQLKKILSYQYTLSIKSRVSSFDSLEDRANQLESELARASNQFKKKNQSITLKDIQNQLSENEAVIEFAHFNYLLPKYNGQTDSILYVAYLFKKGFSAPRMIPLFESKELPKPDAILRLYNLTIMGKRKNLNQLIWSPLEPFLNGIQTIYFSPSGKLHRINFGAIPINEQESISDRFELHQMGSTRQIIHDQSSEALLSSVAYLFGGIEYQSDSHPEAIKDSIGYPLRKAEVLASNDFHLGDAYRSFRGNDWNYLEWTEKEVQEIQELLETAGNESQIYKGKEASEAIFKNLGINNTSPKILHIATHGYFFPDPADNRQLTAGSEQTIIGFKESEHPLIRSGLILAGANRVWKGGEPIPGKEDGILTAYEIAQMDLRNTELVVLSACNTALGDIQGNEGVYGLQRALKIAGLKYILMSLWTVPDKQTHEFMTTFYREYLSGKTIPQAYQFTQNFMRQKYLEPFDPNVWAGFVLVE